MNNNILKILLFFAISIIAGFVSSYFVSNSDSLIIGISSFVIISFLEIQMNQKKILTMISKFDFLIKTLPQKGSYQELVLKNLLKSDKYIKKNGLSAGADGFWDLWIDSIGSARESWIVLNYAKTDILWNKAYAARVDNIQKVQITNGVNIERIFIFDTMDEKKSAEQCMQNHADNGVVVSWILKKDIPKDKTNKFLLKQIGTIDFGVIDDSWIFRVTLDGDKKVKEVNSIQDNVLVEHGKTFINEIRILSKKIPPANNV